MNAMKKIIKGKQYDTETARPLLSTGLKSGNAKATKEALYYTKGQQFFLHGSGDATSRYAQETPDGFVPGEKIIPLTEEAARSWAEEHFAEEICERTFSTLDEGFVAFAMQVPPSVKDRFNDEKTRLGMTAGQLLDHLLNETSKK